MSTTHVTVNSHSASALHARLQIGTRRARQLSVPDARPVGRRPARVSEGSIWKLLDHLHVSAAAAGPALSRDLALRRVLIALLEGTTRTDRPVQLQSCEGPILIVRSGPWPLLRAFLEHLSKWPAVPAAIVLLHRRDGAMLEQMERATNVALRPLFYPRFEPFNPSTLQRVIAADKSKWAASFVLDSSRTGTSRSLDHITRTLASLPGEKYVWNASGNLFQPPSLLETLGRERYEIVRRLLRWRAREGDENSVPAARKSVKLSAVAGSAS